MEKGLKYLLFSCLSVILRSKKITEVPKTGIKKILVIRQHNQLGDMLCAVPLIKALRKTFPEASVSLVARPLNSEILRGCTFIDRLYVYQKQRFWKSPFGALKFLYGIRKNNFDLAITPATVAMSVSSDVLAFLSKAKVRIGPGALDGKKNVTGYMYNIRVQLDWRKTPFVPQTQRNMDIAAILHLESVSHELEIGLQDAEIEAGKSMLFPQLKKERLIIGFHPGAAKIPNRWDALRFAELANRCAEILGAFIVVTAGPNDEEPLHEMLVNMPNECLVLQNEPIRYVASIVKHCRLFVSNDTGMMHVAAGVGTPVISLFGPTDPLQWAPHGEKHRFIMGREGKLENISVEKVWSVMHTMLKQ